MESADELEMRMAKLDGKRTIEVGQRLSDERIAGEKNQIAIVGLWDMTEMVLQHCGGRFGTRP
jgi:hypothetical protein